MLKRIAVRRLAIATLALVLFLITIFFPNKNNEEIFSGNIEYTNVGNNSIYLVDKNNYVSRIAISLKEQNNKIEQAKEMLSLLTIDSLKKDYIPNDFYAVIPKDTKIISVDIQDKTLKLNFNKNFLAIPKENLNQMLESIIYSLTEIKDIDSIIIFIENDLLSTKGEEYEKIPALLTRDFGINKSYDLSHIKNAIKTTTYYIAKTDHFTYYIPVTFIDNQNEKNKIEIIIEKLKSAPIHQTNLISYLHASAELLNYEIIENQIELSFNKYLLDEFYNDKILEEVKYSVFLSLKDSLGIEQVIFKVDSQEI